MKVQRDLNSNKQGVSMNKEELLDKAKEKNFTMYKKEYKTRKNLDSQAITEHNGEISGRLSSKTI